MRVRGKLLPAEFEEVQSFSNAKAPWVRMLRQNWSVLILFLLWGSVIKLIVGDREHWFGCSLSGWW